MHPSPVLELFEPEQIWKRSLLAKVEGLIPWQVYDHLAKCGVEELYRTCRDCGQFKTFYYRCSLKFCPLCNWRIARQRAQLLKLWTLKLTQPKHIVLTARNSQIFTRTRIRKFQKAFSRLRRMKIWRDVKGGCVSTEVTNEGKGWHLHNHILAEVDWIDAGELARAWAKCIGQDFAIVKIKDARGTSYLNEVTKYVVKGSQLASWCPEEIAQFIHAIKGIRFFATFGTLFNFRKEVAAQLAFQKPEPAKCECGSTDFRWEDEVAAILRETK